jgi:hypothetical protein
MLSGGIAKRSVRARRAGGSKEPHGGGANTVRPTRHVRQHRSQLVRP